MLTDSFLYVFAAVAKTYQEQEQVVFELLSGMVRDTAYFKSYGGWVGRWVGGGMGGALEKQAQQTIADKVKGIAVTS